MTYPSRGEDTRTERTVSGRFVGLVLSSLIEGMDGELAILVVNFAVSSISFQKHLTLRETGSQIGDGLHITPSEKGQNLTGDKI